ECVPGGEAGTERGGLPQQREAALDLADADEAEAQAADHDDVVGIELYRLFGGADPLGDVAAGAQRPTERMEGQRAVGIELDRTPRRHERAIGPRDRPVRPCAAGIV